MTTGGGRAGSTACVLVAGALALAGLTGCTETADETRTVSNHLDRIDGVEHVDVTAPSWEDGAAFTITYADADDPKALASLVADIDDVAVEQDFTPYRLALSTAEHPERVLTVDDTFRGSPDEQTALTAWFAIGEEMIGAIDYDVAPDGETIDVDSGGGIAHDVDRARSIGYGDPTTRWTFRDGDTTFAVGGAVTSGDVTLLADVQSDVASAGLPATASGWRLGRYAGHVRLDVDVAIDDPPTASGLTAKDYGDQVEPLASAALAALRATGLRRFLSLQQVDDPDDSPDVFATWTSTQPPAPGRDRLGRGWDGWLERLADA